MAPGGIFEGFGLLGILLVCPGCTWSAFWVRLRASEVRLGGVLGLFWASWADLGQDLGSLGGFQGAFWKHFLIIDWNLYQYAQIAKNLGKTMVCH